MFGLDASLSPGLTFAFVACLVMTFFFEFVNGFHDTANAVATVIYTKSLKPVVAVVYSGILNFLGVVVSSFAGFKVAMGIVNLLPIETLTAQSTASGAAMVLAVLLGAIIWNLGTWYFGIPCSSSHTLIGALLGVGIVFSTLPENTTGVGVNWKKATEIGESLLFSPLFGFSVAIALMFILKGVVKSKAIFSEPPADSRPPLWIRSILWATCGLVSFFHGFNDGQKGLGLLLVTMLTFMPLKYSLSPDFNQQSMATTLTTLQSALPGAQTSASSAPKEVGKVIETIELLKQDVAQLKDDDVKGRLNVRKRIGVLTKNLTTYLNEPNVIVGGNERSIIKAEIKKLDGYIAYIPTWGIALISIALGIGTMIGWKRIVVTIGEKIGKRHMTYAEGATAEVVASSTIALASGLGLPVSTTHVLSSGVAGAMVASKGTKNLQRGTIGNIVLAWVLTLPATIILSGGLYLLFRLFI